MKIWLLGNNLLEISLQNIATTLLHTIIIHSSQSVNFPGEKLENYRLCLTAIISKNEEDIT